MPRIKKKPELNDEYFINLTMDYDKRDDEIYPKWAVWCASSNDKYYIDGKDHHFYTHERTDEEIKIERKKREILDMIHIQDRNNTTPEEWQEYEEYLNNSIMDIENILDFIPMYFTEWKDSKK